MTFGLELLRCRAVPGYEVYVPKALKLVEVRLPFPVISSALLP